MRGTERQLCVGHSIPPAGTRLPCMVTPLIPEHPPPSPIESPQPSQAAAYSPSPDYESCRSLINRFAACRWLLVPQPPTMMPACRRAGPLTGWYLWCGLQLFLPDYNGVRNRALHKPKLLFLARRPAPRSHIRGPLSSKARAEHHAFSLRRWVWEMVLTGSGSVKDWALRVHCCKTPSLTDACRAHRCSHYNSGVAAVGAAARQ